MSVLFRIAPKSRLSELAGRFGGLSRDEAVQAATRELEVMRPESDKAILSAITQLEQAVAGAPTDNDASVSRQLLPLCDQIDNLAGTFGYVALNKAARSLCDLLDGLLTQGKSDRASIRVHVQTIRMLAPGARALGNAQIQIMLLELDKLLDFHGFARPDCKPEDEFGGLI
jgi:hypothetical protein